MKMYQFLLLILFSSCLKTSIELETFTSDLLENENYHDQAFSFAPEYKIVEWYKNQSRTEIKQFYFENDGHRIKGYVLLPKVKKLASYPTLIHLRGGWGSYKKPSLFLFKWLSQFVEKGYVVVSSDLRGANGIDKQLDEFGGKDFRDVERLFEIVKDLDFVDSSHLHTISWGSRGGVMSYLALKSELSFKSAVIINGASDLFLLEKERQQNFFAEIIKEGKDEAFKKRSGIYWADAIKKPVFIIHGEKDDNTSVEHAEKMAEKLKLNHKEYQLKIYKGLGHDLIGADHVEQSVNWFQAHR